MDFHETEWKDVALFRREDKEHTFRCRSTSDSRSRFFSSTFFRIFNVSPAKKQITHWYECFTFSAAWLNLRGRWGLSGGMNSIESHSSSLYYQNYLLKQKDVIIKHPDWWALWTHSFHNVMWCDVSQTGLSPPSLRHWGQLSHVWILETLSHFI